MNDENLYSKLGVSSKKEDVHEAIKDVDEGLFPGAFCKVVEDVSGRDDYCSIFHADGAGTKSSLAYMYYKEMGDISVFRGIVRDAMIMNIDDLLCVGATGPIFFSNNIGRNSYYITGEIIAEIIDEYHAYSKKLSKLGLPITMTGGETADVGDLVKTLIVDASAFTSMKRKDVINANNIQNDDVIIGLASFGKATYEKEYNSGIGSNGLTLARHGTLLHKYFHDYPECYDQNLDEELIFFGKYALTDKIEEINLSIGKALLSPTRTYAPILIPILKKYRKSINGLIHNTGGGQTKVLNFGKNIRFIKNSLFSLPKIFEIIQNSSETQWKEMYQVFNMGHRLEIYCNENIANEIIHIAKKYDINAKIIGHCEDSTNANKNELVIQSQFGEFKYSL
jgi:phosphoribosylformylglycinamidine cyclo-ligase